MAHPKDIGDRTTLAVMLALREAGLGILVPFGENTRYDLVIDGGDRNAADYEIGRVAIHPPDSHSLLRGVNELVP